MRSAAATPIESATQQKPKPRVQFALNSMLLGMFVFAIFFGTSGAWYRWSRAQSRQAFQQIDQLRAELQREQRAHRETKARLLVAETQLQDAVGVRIGRQVAEREAAEENKKQLVVLTERLLDENKAARREIEDLRRQLQSLREDRTQ